MTLRLAPGPQSLLIQLLKQSDTLRYSPACYE